MEKKENKNVDVQLEEKFKDLTNRNKTFIDKSQIVALTVSVMSGEEIRKMAVKKIDSDDLEDLDGGLYDRHLGTIDNEECAECHQNVMGCPGHFGFIELYEAFPHPYHLKTIARLLNCFCYECEDEKGNLKLLMPEQELEGFKNLKGMERLKAINNTAKKGCNKHQCREYNVQKDNIVYTYKKKNATVVSTDKLEIMLSKMSDHDLELLGVNMRPENFILHYIPVLPINLRPYNIQDGKPRHNDLTLIYKEIITANKLRNSEKVRLYYRGLIDNKPGGCKGLQGHVYLTFKELIDTKKGLLRNTVYGKRGDFSARTVITPDPNIKVYELGTPIEIARTLTTKEDVTNRNIKQMKQLIMDDGVKILYQNGMKILLSTVKDKSKIELKPGDRVDRYLRDGDPVVFNRQPTLHKQSMIGLLVRIIFGKTFRLNPAICSGLNADFDGDEGNIVVAQTYLSKAEALDVMNIKDCMISDQTSKPITGIVQDSLTSIYLMTGEYVVVDKDLWNDAVFHGNRQHMIESLKKRVEKLGMNLYSGRSLFSILLPEDFVFIRSVNDQNYEIQNGVLISGQLDKNVLSSGPNSIIQVLHRSYGKDVTAEFISDLQRLANHWIQEEGFSVGYGNCLLEHKDTYKEVTKAIESTKKRAMGKVEDPLLMLKQEAEINQLLNNSRNIVAKIILEEGKRANIAIDEFVKKITLYHLTEEKLLDHTDIVNLEINIPKNLLVATLRNGDRRSIDTKGLVAVSIETKDSSRTFTYRATVNPLKAMVNSGAKGTNLNISQIMGNVGQQNIGGKRIPFSLTNDTRVLPHFESQDLNPEARGFCTSGYFQGLNPLEFYMAAIGGRESLADVAVKTSETGYVQRRLSKLMEDHVTNEDGSVRTATGRIIQFQYGNNGFSTDRMVKVKGQITFTDVPQRFSELSQRKIFSKFAYVYFAPSDDFVKSILVSAHSLRLNNTSYQLVVIVNPSVSLLSQSFLKQVFDRVIVYDTTSPWWCLNLVEYEKILFVGPELIFLRNVDSLFNLSPPAATFSRHYAYPYDPKGAFNPYLKYQKHGSIIPPSVLLQAISEGHFTALDSLVLLKPDINIWNSLQTLMSKNPDTRSNVALITVYANNNISFTNIHQIYQLLPLVDPKYYWLYDTGYSPRDAFGFNFYSDSYPWKLPSDTPNISYWLDITEDMLVDYPEFAVFYD